MLNWLKRLLGLSEQGPDPAAPMLPCEEVQKRLFEYLDQELNEETAAGVKAHLDACPECYPRAQFERHFIETVQRARTQATAGEALQKRILDALAEELPGE